MLRNIIGIACVAVTFMLAACNTMEGVGKDIERGGEKIQGAAEKAK
jgi:predicted small secreted protein